jgi:RNA polymerase sigma factor (sigma-70 family)
MPNAIGMTRLDDFCKYDRPLAVHWARAVLRSEDAIDECVQAAFVRAAMRIHLYDATLPFRPWFKSVVVRECLGWLRNQRRHSHIPLDDCESLHGPSIDDMIQPEQQEMRMCAEKVWQETSSVRELHRWIVRAIDFSGMSHEEACAILGYQPAAFTSRLHRARKAVRERVVG